MTEEELMVVSCPSCTQRFRVRKQSAGRAVKCPHCSQAVSVPHTASSGGGQEGFQLGPPARPKPNLTPTPQTQAPQTQTPQTQTQTPMSAPSGMAPTQPTPVAGTDSSASLPPTGQVAGAAPQPTFPPSTGPASGPAFDPTGMQPGSAYQAPTTAQPVSPQAVTPGPVSPGPVTAGPVTAGPPSAGPTAPLTASPAPAAQNPFQSPTLDLTPSTIAGLPVKRRYPALQIIRTIYLVMACLVVAGWAIFMAVTLVLASQAGAIGLWFYASLIPTASAAATATLLVAVAELIKLALDVQANTLATARATSSRT